MTPAPSRAPTRALPPELTALLDTYRDAIRVAEGESARRPNSPYLQAIVDREDATRETLDAALLQFVEDGRRYKTLRRLLTDDMRSVEEIRTHAPSIIDALVDKFTSDAARSVIAAPVGEAEQP